VLSLRGRSSGKRELTFFKALRTDFFFHQSTRKNTILFLLGAHRKIAKEEEWRDHPETRRMTSRIIAKGATRAEAE
jgi:hypothetical protein